MRRESSIGIVLALALTWSLTPPAAAQDWVGRGRVQGEVLDSSGNPIQGATVSLYHRGREGVGPASVTTDRRGRWSLLGLSHGSWTVLIEKEGYLPSQGPVMVNEAGMNPPINVTLTSIDETPQAQRARELVAGIDQANRLFQEGRYAEARELYQESMEEVDEETRLDLERAVARTYFAEESWEEAARRLQQIDARHPGDLETLKLLAATQNEQGHGTAAMETLRRVLEIAPDDADVLELMASLLISAGREDEARQYLARLPEGRQVDPSAFLNRGIEHYNNGDYEQAVAIFDQVATQYPELVDVFYYRAMSHLAQGNVAEAKADFQKLVDLAPDHPRADEAREFLTAL